MTLTIDKIYTRYSVREFTRKIEIKRRNQDGTTYEDEWQDVEELSGLKLLDNSVKNISYKLNNNSYNFGIVNVNNAQIQLNSKNGQFDDENNSGSVFKGFLRHKSQIRVLDGYVDKYTDPDNPENVLVNVFEGFIDGTSNSTKVDDDSLSQTLLCLDKLSFLLKEFTIADMGSIVNTTLSDVIYEILNRSEFTDFFTVDSLNINPGYDILSLDLSQYEGQTQLFTVFENLSIGHSFFYIRDSIFYYKNVTDGNSINFTIDSKKLIKPSNYDNGIQNVFEKLYWENSTEVYNSPTNNYNKSQTIDIKACVNTTQRTNVLSAIGAITKIQRKRIKVSIPYYMNIFILDSINIDPFEIIPEDAFVWGVSKWGEKRWRKAIKADSISNSDNWIIREIQHSDLTTNLIVEQDI